ncbi:DUF4931 domain-containing protein [Gottfriedia sp. OAE603]|uniref:DUF4931 domain-containing protein n=1 Tax=Gottfriedia sp. OAE603 TaxID=2663872 RepID=UPI00178A4C0B
MDIQNELLQFKMDIGIKKPENIVNKTVKCPFCDRENLTDILDTSGSIIYLKNKFPTLEDTLQTVIIETDDCDGDISKYSQSHMNELLNFAVQKWEEMEKTEEFKSVIFYKNHGPLSGGTLNHPHMQIVGLKNIDYKKKITDIYFEGIKIFLKEGVELNISTHPMMGFREFNIIIEDRSYLSEMAVLLQIVTHYLLNNFYNGLNSYNLFFYKWNGKIICKVIPRFVVSPLFIGYSISQVTNQLDVHKNQILKLYKAELFQISH